MTDSQEKRTSSQVRVFREAMERVRRAEKKAEDDTVLSRGKAEKSLARARKEAVESLRVSREKALREGEELKSRLVSQGRQQAALIGKKCEEEKKESNQKAEKRFSGALEFILAKLKE